MSRSWWWRRWWWWRIVVLMIILLAQPIEFIHKLDVRRIEWIHSSHLTDQRVEPFLLFQWLLVGFLEKIHFRFRVLDVRNGWIEWKEWLWCHGVSSRGYIKNQPSKPIGARDEQIVIFSCSNIIKKLPLDLLAESINNYYHYYHDQNWWSQQQQQHVVSWDNAHIWTLHSVEFTFRVPPPRRYRSNRKTSEPDVLQIGGWSRVSTWLIVINESTRV